MCGLVGAITERNVTPILLEGLKRLEYRGYDSAGIAVLMNNNIQRLRTLGKVSELTNALKGTVLKGNIGIAHTRWATHGMPSEINAHPHMSDGDIALVHNGIIENYAKLRKRLKQENYQFNSDTDTEVIVHLIHKYLNGGKNLLKAVQNATQDLEGAFALAILHKNHPKRLIAVRCGSPLVIGLGIEENFLASDILALLPVTQKFIYLEEGDIADINDQAVVVYDKNVKKVERVVHTSMLTSDVTDRGAYRHFMLKEIYEQPKAVKETLGGRLSHKRVDPAIFGVKANALFSKVNKVEIIACGTSFHAGLVGHYWLEAVAGIPCNVEVASEYRYRQNVVEDGTLFVTLSQSGETADTLAALKKAKEQDYVGYLAICNVPESSLVRESELVFLTHAGVEIGVASTKSFTTQLVSLLLLTLSLSKDKTDAYCQQLLQIEKYLETILKLDDAINRLAYKFQDKQHALFLGRGIHYPIAMEGALKLKEISYIHAEAYPAGELKHGPLALIDSNMPVVAVAPNDELLEKLISNLNEVQARGGELIVFADESIDFEEDNNIHILKLPAVDSLISPIVYTLPLQLLAYHVAILKGTDVDQPRNLAKSVTVE